jgi:cell division transport system permease protein
MFWTNTKRVIRAGFVNFWRNGFVSFSSIFVMIITLLVIGSILFTNVLLKSALANIESKVDINVYFVTTATESDILAIQQELQALPEVSSATYISADQALADFKQRHQDDQFTLQALDELNSNPLGAIINIQAKDPSQYGAIADFLQSKSVSPTDGLPIIDKINYNQNQAAIDKLTSIINLSREVGIALTIILAAVTILVTFNTIRLTIYISREEISIMRLVGASNKYVRGPFVIVGIMYGIISAIIATGLLWPIAYFLNKAQNLFGVSVYSYYIDNFGQIFLIILGAGIVIGAVSSYLAVRRYLKV